MKKNHAFIYIYIKTAYKKMPASACFFSCDTKRKPKDFYYCFVNFKELKKKNLKC